MSFEQVEGQRLDTANAILSKFGASIERAQQNAAAKTNDQALKRLTAARIALEYAVLATARERRMSTELVATTLKAASLEQQSLMIKQGAAALGRAYGVEPDVLVNAFAGRLADVQMPKGLGSTPEIDKMVDKCRTLVTSIVNDEYGQRGKLSHAGGRSDSFITPLSDGLVSATKSELAARMAFMESSIDAAVGKGAISQGNAAMLKERIEAQVFQPRPPQSLQFSKEFLAFFEQRGKAIRIDAMRDVRGITQSATVQQISERLKDVMPRPPAQARPANHQTQKPLER